MHLTLFCASQHPDELHRLRLEVKRVEACVFLLHAYDSHDDILLLFEPVRRIFKQTGVIRNAQINLRLANSNKIVDDAFEREQREVLAYHTNLFLAKSHIAAIKLARKELSKRISPIPNRFILRFFKKQLVAISNILDSEWGIAEVHLCRKRIKQLWYIHDMLGKPLRRRIRLNVKYLELLQDTIGNLHDTSAVLVTLSEGNATDKDHLATLEQSVSALIGSIRSISANFISKSTLGKG